MLSLADPGSDERTASPVAPRKLPVPPVMAILLLTIVGGEVLAITLIDPLRVMASLPPKPK